MDDLWGIYAIGRVISFWVIFVGCWIYCVATYGFLLGGGIGWLPSLIAAFLLSFLWPLIAALLILIIWLLSKH